MNKEMNNFNFSDFFRYLLQNLNSSTPPYIDIVICPMWLSALPTFLQVKWCQAK